MRTSKPLLQTTMRIYKQMRTRTLITSNNGMYKQMRTINPYYKQHMNPYYKKQ